MLIRVRSGLWAVLNNAGLCGAIGATDWLTHTDYQVCLDVNLLGLIDVTLTFLPLVKRGQGRVVNVASILGRFASPGLSPYCVSKYGVEAFSDILRFVNNVAVFITIFLQNKCSLL